MDLAAASNTQQLNIIDKLVKPPFINNIRYFTFEQHKNSDDQTLTISSEERHRFITFTDLNSLRREALKKESAEQAVCPAPLIWIHTLSKPRNPLEA